MQTIYFFLTGLRRAVDRQRHNGPAGCPKSMYVFGSLSVCICVFVCLSLRLLSVCLCLFVCLSLLLCLFVFASLSMHLVNYLVEEEVGWSDTGLLIFRQTNNPAASC